MITPISTLIPPDLSTIEATKLAGQGGTALKCRPAAQSITMADGSVIVDTIHLNADGNSGAAARGYRFVAPYSGPLGFWVPMAKPPWFPGASAPVIYLTNSAGTVLASTVCTLSATGQLYTVSASVTGGQEYQARITCYDAALQAIQNSQALIGPAYVRMASRGSGLFSRNFIRIDAKANETVQYTCYGTVWDGRTEFSSLAEIVLETDADSLIVESRATSNDDQFCAGAVMIGSPGTRALAPWAKLDPLVTDRVFLSPEIALPPGRKRVAVRQGPLSAGLGMFPRAVLLPASAGTVIVPQSGGRTLLIMSDSIGSGSTSTTVAPATGSWSAARGFPALMRNKFRGNVVLDTFGGRALATDGYVATGGVLSAVANDVTQRAALIDRLGQCSPTDILILLGCNDWQSNVSAANWQVAYQALLADLLARYPHVRLFPMTPVYRASLSAETSPNTGGATMPNLRTALINAAAAAIAAEQAKRPTEASVPPKIKVLDGLSAAGALEIGIDGLHLAGGPSYWAAEKAALYVLGQMES